MFPNIIQLYAFVQNWGYFMGEELHLELNYDDIEALTKSICSLVTSQRYLESPFLLEILDSFYEIQDEKIKEIFIKNHVVDSILNLLKNLDGKNKIKEPNQFFFIQCNMFLSQFYETLSEKNDFDSLIFLFNVVLNEVSDESFIPAGRCLFGLETEIQKSKKKGIELSCRSINIKKYLDMLQKYINNEDVEIQSIAHSMSALFLMISEFKDWKEESTKYKGQLLQILDKTTQEMGQLLGKTERTTDSSCTAFMMSCVLERDSFIYLNEIMKNCFTMLKKEKKKPETRILAIIFILLYQCAFSFEELMEPYLSNLELLDLIILYCDSKLNRVEAYDFLYTYFYIENKAIESSVSKLKILNQFDKEKSDISSMYNI